MGALAWLFGLGALAAIGPFVFHLIRRTPKGQVEFSSLMFLRATPPTITRRSRLDNLLLLFLRMAAVGLIAAAFMRPFFASNLKLDFTDIPGKKIAVVLDTSASMQRNGLWTQAVSNLQRVVAQAEEKDTIRVFTFDQTLKEQIPQSNKSELAKLDEQLLASKNIQPGWLASDLGKSLVELSNLLISEEQEDSESSENGGVSDKLQVVLISDMQSGSSTSALQNYQWPEQVKVRIDQVVAKQGTNATLELLPPDESDPQQCFENVLVRNSSDSTSDQFSVEWASQNVPATQFVVPPGSSKILRVPRDQSSINSNQLSLGGDDADFDNQYFALPPIKQQIEVCYFGDESPDDPEKMLFYLKRSLIETPVFTFDLQQSVSGNETAAMTANFVVITRPLSTQETNSIDDLLKTGTTLLVVASDSTLLDSVQAWTGIVEHDEDANSNRNDYAMLGAIDFSHPLFDPFSGPRFNDFTQIRFWEHLRPKLADNVQVLAHFDDDTPALWHQLAHEHSDIYVLGCGWQPAKSQLALSSKFLPLIMRMAELSAPEKPVRSNYVAGDALVASESYDRIESPNGSVQSIDQSTATIFERPGIYTVKAKPDSGLVDTKIAVNLDPAESRTDVMPLDQLSALGVALGTHSTTDQEIEQQRQLKDVELENRQKIWKWLLLTAIGLVIGETFFAGRTDRKNSQRETGLQETSNE